MAIVSSGELDTPEPLSGSGGAMLRWYAAYTRARHEKKIAAHLSGKQVESYLPLYQATHIWNRRRAVVELPLFPGYVFVHITLSERLRVLEVPGVLHLVGNRLEATPLADAEVEQLRHCLSLGLASEPIDYLHPGDPVRIVAGPLAGWRGRVVRREGETRLVLAVDLIRRAVAVTVDASHLERLAAASA